MKKYHNLFPAPTAKTVYSLNDVAVRKRLGEKVVVLFVGCSLSAVRCQQCSSVRQRITTWHPRHHQHHQWPRVISPGIAYLQIEMYSRRIHRGRQRSG